MAKVSAGFASTFTGTTIFLASLSVQLIFISIGYKRAYSVNENHSQVKVIFLALTPHIRGAQRSGASQRTKVSELDVIVRHF